MNVRKASPEFWQRRYEEAERQLGLLMSPDNRKSIFQRARAYAGGKAKAAKMKMQKEGEMMDSSEDVIKLEGGPDAILSFVGNLRKDLTASDVHVDKPLSEEKGKGKKKVSIMANTNIVKSDDEKRLVTGIVLEPYTVDSQGDWETPEDIEKAAHAFMAMYREMGIEHVRKNEDIYPVESYIAPTDLIWEYPDGEERVVKSGSWIMTAKVLDANAWDDVKNGDLTGFSVEGRGHHEPGREPPDPFYLTGEIEKRDIPQSARDKMPSGDFAGKGTSFPISTQADVDAAFHSLGRAGSDNYPSDTIRRNIIRIARRKGFTLPKSAQGDKD